MSDSSLVSIIIVNYNGKPHLEKCLESLLKIQNKNYEIIIIDNNSTDGSIEFLESKYPQIIIKKLEKNLGFAYPNNLGSKIANGKFLLFLNNDTIATSTFLDHLLSVFEDEKIGICQSMLLHPDETVDSSGDFIDSIGVVFSSKDKIKNIREILSAKGASLMIRKSLFEKLGGFDEKFFVSFEDVDLGWRCWIIGYKVVINPNSIVYHLGGQTIKKIKSTLPFHGMKNQLVMKITNFESIISIKSIFLFFLIYGFRSIRIWFDYAINGKTLRKSTEYEDTIAQKPDFKSLFKSIFWLLENRHYISKKKDWINHNRVYSTKELIEKKLIKNRYS